jgi:DNA (cytosine-5)-methyltransferase 1
MAWEPLGWTASFFSEIEKFPRAVLTARWPDTPLHGDFTTIKVDEYEPIDVLVGGTPCQSFSIAGLRRGLGDDRGNLALEYLRLAQRLRPRWLVWENVPGVLSSGKGRDFGSILGGMVELGYGFSYRVLDAQNYGVPQRRRRVFVVAYLRDWRRAAAVLFERESMSGHPPPRREEGQRVADSLTVGANQCSGFPGDFVEECLPKTTNPLTARMHKGVNTTADEGQTMITHALRGEGFDASEDGTGRGVPLVAQPYSIMPMNSGKDYKARPTDVAQPVMAGGPVGGNQGGDYIVHRYAVRRLTPRECERLQGFPDDYTQIAWRGKAPELCPDGPRYKALGNSMAVPVMRWIGKRIAMVEAS